MNKVHKTIQDQIVGPAVQSVATSAVGILRAFNPNSQTGDVVFDSVQDRDEHVVPNVPLINITGLKRPDPLPGDPMLIVYLNGDNRYPVMLASVEPIHFLTIRNEKQSHFRTGGNATDIYSMREGEMWNDKGLI